ncbi:TPA: hypothetical protein ACURE6_001963 [Staphylococcus aureus]
MKLDPQFLQTMQVGGAPTQRNWISSFYRQCKLAGPQHREIGFPISTDNASWGNGPNTETGFLISTDDASWRGSNTETGSSISTDNASWGNGPQHSEIGFPISTDNASWGNGPQTQKLVESQLL